MITKRIKSAACIPLTAASATRWLVILVSVIAALLCANTATAGNVDGAPEAVATQHQLIMSDGSVLKYTATAGRIAIRDVATGVAHGYMFYVSYRELKAPRNEPVIFIWNGGPGANASTLQFYAAGPRIYEDGKLIANRNTWLRSATIVFVDPIGTGYSRPSEAKYQKEFYGTIGDVRSVAEFVRCWLIDNNATSAPVYLVGESWGAGRAAHVAPVLQKAGLSVRGLVLISGGFGLSKKYLPQPLRRALPIVDMATIAAFWHRNDASRNATIARLREDSLQWVDTIYAPALADPASVTPANRSRIVKKLSELTGIDEALIDRKTLYVTASQFRRDLVPGKVLFTLDGRRVSEPPSVGSAAIVAYFRRSLQYGTDLPYIGDGPDGQGWETGYASGRYPQPVGQSWDYATGPVTKAEVAAAVRDAVQLGLGPPVLGPPLPGVEAVVNANPRVKILVVDGMYDTYMQCARGSATERALPPELRRAVTFKCFPDGHEVYRGDATAVRQLAGYINELVSH